LSGHGDARGGSSRDNLSEFGITFRKLAECGSIRACAEGEGALLAQSGGVSKTEPLTKEAVSTHMDGSET
jgi:hypothetical protein